MDNEFDSSTTTSNSYRTKNKAAATDNYPDNIAVPTFQPYQFATSLFQNGNAYLQAGVNTKNLKFQDGKLFFEDSTGIMRRVSEVELITDFATKEPITQIDGLSFLRAYYSILLAHYISALKNHEPLPKIIKLYMPDFAEFLDYDRNISKETVNSIVRKMISFHKVIGVMRNKIGDKIYTSYYPIFHFEGYNAESNTIEIYSPYLNRVIENILKEAVKLNTKTHQPILDKIGKPVPLASHSYLIKPSIARERNFIAVENVVLIVQLIEQAGDNTPHIKASTLIERNPQLQYRLNEADSKNKSNVLKRIFKGTWELLREQTHLIEVYKNIKLPDPYDPANIPTVKSLKKMVFAFPHEGKIKK